MAPPNETKKEASAFAIAFDPLLGIGHPDEWPAAINTKAAAEVAVFDKDCME